MDLDGDFGHNPDGQLIKKLIRYAISCEYSRTVIRRDGIKERGTSALRATARTHVLIQRAVLGNQGRSFKRIFAAAQKQLRTVWGMELRELPVREKISVHEKRQGKVASVTPNDNADIAASYEIQFTTQDWLRSLYTLLDTTERIP